MRKMLCKLCRKLEVYAGRAFRGCTQVVQGLCRAVRVVQRRPRGAGPPWRAGPCPVSRERSRLDVVVGRTLTECDRVSRPFLQSVNKRIEEMGGDDWIFEQIADGVPMKKIAEQVGCSRPYLYNWRDQKPHKEARRERWAEAMKASAESQAEDAGVILDELAESPGLLIPVDVQLAQARSKYRQWLAEVRDKETFGGGKSGPAVVLNIHALHLDALRQVGSMSLAVEQPAALIAAGPEESEDEDE